MQQRLLIGLGIAACVAVGAVVAWPSLNPLTAEWVRPNGYQKKPKRKRKEREKEPLPEVPREHDHTMPPDRAAAPEGAPNVVLVFGCTVRKDQTSLHSDLDTTPWLASQGASGVVFEDALSVSSWTRASAVGALTGNHPFVYNLPEPGPRQSQRMLTIEATTLAEHLAKAGWVTFGSTANPNLNVMYGMAQGMDHYRDSFPRAFKRGRQGGKDVVQEALGMLDARTEAERERPFYMQLMLIDAHHPRRPEPGDIGDFQDPDVSNTLVRYRASLRQVDRALEDLDSGLAERGYTPANTVFVFLADHGEGLESPQHHRGGHGKKMFPTSVAIPWTISGPDIPAGRRVEGIASGVDVTPTVLGLLDLPEPEDIDGIDLSAWVTGKRTGKTPRTRAFSASMFHVADVAAIWTPQHQCQNHYDHDRDKVVTGCFDRIADPDFEHPIAMPDLQQELDDTRAALIERGASVEIHLATASDEVQEQLKLLGYADEDE